MKSIEFVWFQTVKEKTFIPLPGMKHSVWAGDGEPEVQVVISAVDRLDDKGRYKLTLRTSDSRMLALNERCDHSTHDNHHAGPDVCVKCNIVVR